MRNRGRHIVLLLLASAALAACGGGDPQQSSSGGGKNLPPIIEGTPVTTLAAGSSYSFTPQAADPNGDKLTFVATGLPSWLKLDATTGTISGTPTEANVGMTGMITIGVSDSEAETDLPSFRIQITSAASTPPPGGNHAPTIAGTPPTTATVGKLYTFMPVGDDADNDTLSYSIDNKPTWVTFTPATGQLSGTPTSADIGTTTNVVVHVTDGAASADLPAFDIQVVSTAPANRAPTISGTPAGTVTAGTAYSFRPVASDPDGDTLQFSIQGQPSWATFSATTGRLTGTPSSANVGTSTRITITVSDGKLAASLASFTIQVNATANRPPTIAGTPAKTVLVGAAYSFQPSAADADGNTLTFRIDNKPAWATFSTSTGRLSGTPAAADAGSYANIVISVSDGTASTSLAAYTLTVAQIATGTATVSWTAPTTNTDGTTLTDLSGYRIAYGQSQDTLDQSASVDSNVATYTISNLTSGTWYFGVYAVNTVGLESSVSNIGSKTIQ